jgi:hypothetical protein
MSIITTLAEAAPGITGSIKAASAPSVQLLASV